MLSRSTQIRYQPADLSSAGMTVVPSICRLIPLLLRHTTPKTINRNKLPNSNVHIRYLSNSLRLGWPRGKTNVQLTHTSVLSTHWNDQQLNAERCDANSWPDLTPTTSPISSTQLVNSLPQLCGSYFYRALVTPVHCAQKHKKTSFDLDLVCNRYTNQAQKRTFSCWWRY